MTSSAAKPLPPLRTGGHQGHPIRSYPRFLLFALRTATDGDWRFYSWMILLTAVALVGANAWAHQVSEGMHVTGMNDHVSWGLYIANFTFMVGVAAAAVMMVIPAYIYKNHEMHDAVIVGELLAIAAIVMCIAYVVVDLGRPDRMWHMLPGLGQFQWPGSMLTWDVIVLNGYLLLNLHICGYLLYQRFLGKKPDPRWYRPFVFLSIVWAVSIHTVTAFLYCGLGGRPFWNSALLAPRFLVSAFVAGPAFIIIALTVLRRFGTYPFADGPIRLLVNIVRVTCLINLFMLGSEIFTILYAGNTHAGSLKYLMFGLHGHHGLVAWFWSAMALNVVAAILVLQPRVDKRVGLLVTACLMTFVGVWIEKGMGLIVPGFIPSTLHEVVEYMPSLTEWKVSAGVFALGLMIFTCLLKIALPVLSGWTPALSVGNQHIDAQHQSLFEQLDRLVHGLRHGDDSQAARETMGFLSRYTEEHFSDEERLMERLEYPGLAGHRRRHGQFKEQLAQISRELDDPAADNEAVAVRLHESVREWLVHHIAEVDKRFGEWLQDRGFDDEEQAQRTLAGDGRA